MRKFLLALFLLPAYLSEGQSSCPGVDAGPDVSICTGGSVQLNASGGFNYAWTPSSTLSDTTIYNPVASPSVTTTYYVSASVAQSNSNLIVNGDFEQGNTGFSSSYGYATNLFPTGLYNVGSNPSNYNPNFSSCTDHTSGTGMMMIMNGSTNANTNVWCQTVAVTANTDYIFSMWACQLYANSPAQLQLTINGQAVGSTFTLTTTTCVWYQFSILWNSGINTTASLCITDLNTVGGGNDFALDDISLSPTCSSTDSVTVTVQPNNIVANAGPDTTICTGQSATLTASGGSVYQWNNGAGNTATVTVMPAVTTTYVVTVSSPGCSASTDSVTVFVLPDPVPVITQSGDSLFCSTNPAYTGYQWYFNNTLITGATDTIYVITQSGSYTVKVTNSNGCTSTATKTANLVVPTANFSVVTHTCTNQCVDFTNLSVNATSYKWQFPGATPSTSSAINPQNICYKNIGSYTVVLTAYNTGTSNVKTYSYIVVSAAPPVPVVTQSNDTLFCKKNAAYISYQWYYNNAIIPGATDTSLVATQNGNYTIIVTDANGCSQSVTKTVGIASPLASFSSVTNLCVNSCIDFTNLSQNATSYKWLFTGANPSSDTAVNPHNICYNSTGTYTVVLIAFNSLTSDTITLTNYITINSPPPPPVITQSGAILYSSTDPSYALYQWYYNNTSLTGATDTSLTITQGGNYKVQVTDANGCTDTTTVNAVLIIPQANFSALNNICANSCIDFTNLSINAISYQWFFPGGMPTSDTSANPQSICYLTGGNYDVTLIATNSGGNDTLTLTNYINVYTSPPTPLLTLVGTTLYCTTNPTYTGYQWFEDATLIPGATDTLLVITQSGNYNVQVTDVNGCQIAVGINVILTGTRQFVAPENSFYLFPNPVNDKLFVNGYTLNGSVELAIYNVLGQKYSQSEIVNLKSEISIDVSPLTAGVYFVRASHDHGIWIGRFVKQ